MAKYFIKDRDNNILNPIFIDCVLKKYTEGFVRERWEFSGRLKFFGGEAEYIDQTLNSDSILLLNLFDENDILIMNLVSYNNKKETFSGQRIITISVEKYQEGHDRYGKFDPYVDLSDEQRNWLYGGTNNTPFRVQRLESQRKEITIENNSATPPTAKNNYVYTSTTGGGGFYTHYYRKQICKFKPSGSYSGNFEFIDDFYGVTSGGVAQNPSEPYFECLEGYFSCKTANELTDLYADCVGVPNWYMCYLIGATFIEYEQFASPEAYNKYLDLFDYNGEYPYSRIIWADASDVKRFYQSEPATENLISSNEIANIYKALFDLEYRFYFRPNDIDPTYLDPFIQLVHPSENTLNDTIDLTNYKNNNWTSNYKKISYDKEKIFKVNQFNESQRQFWNEEVYNTLSSNYVKKEKNTQSKVILDVKDLIENPDKYPDDAIVILSTVKNFTYDVWETGIIGGGGELDRPNSYMFPNALRYFHKYYNHYTNEDFNILFFPNVTAIAEKTGKLDTVFVPISFQEIDITKEVNTDLGACRIESYELNLDGSFAKLNLIIN